MVYRPELFLTLHQIALKNYEHIFFDLDRTLWDFERNSYETLFDLHQDLNLKDKNITAAEDFIQVYKSKNRDLWVLYRKGLISKDELRRERFHQALLHFNLNDPELAVHINDLYVANCSSKPHLLPHTKEVLDYLSKTYHLHIITNGFIEAQSVKMKSTGLENYFKAVIVSDGLGYRKPDKRIFHHALKLAGANQKNSLMIGDDYEADIIGARKVGMDQIFLNIDNQQNHKATFEVGNLLELKEIL